MGFSLETSIPAITVFIQGVLSFFSPCVLPLVPLYVSYLAGGTRSVDEKGTIVYPKTRVMVNTFFFVLGISFSFFLLGLGFTAIGSFFSGNHIWFARISGMIMILFGLYQFGLLGDSFLLSRERRLSLPLNKLAMNPLTALLLGFTFSFAWTPCVGPALGSVLLMASSAEHAGSGFALIAVYTLGFVIPFLAVGLFTGTVLGFFKRYQKIVKYTVKVGAVLLVLMGIMTLTGFMNGITGYLSVAGDSVSSDNSSVEQTPAQDPPQVEKDESSEYPTIPAPDFTLLDQYGNTHTLSEYKGKTVFLNFWATWCGPCQREMPEIQALYERYGSNSGELIVLGVANPKNKDHPHNQDVSENELIQFLDQMDCTFPVVMDVTGDMFAAYGISAFPTTFMIDSDGNVFGYVVSSLTGDMMESIVEQTMTGIRVK